MTSQLIKNNCLWALMAAALCAISSCKMHFGAATPEYPSVSYFIPGECLSSTELISTLHERSGYQLTCDGRYKFALLLDLSNCEIDDSRTYSTHPRCIPSEELFSSFGENEALIKKAYNDQNYLLHNPEESYTAPDVVTILYCGGMTLVADKPFAGHPAGENLAPYCQNYYPTNGTKKPVLPNSNLAGLNNGKNFIDPLMEIPIDYGCILGHSIIFSIPTETHKVVEERVNFEITIPVKVVMYLQWINNKLADPLAPVPYREETLHCVFHTMYNLK